MGDYVDKAHALFDICIYIYVLEIFLLCPQKALRELGIVPPRELGTRAAIFALQKCIFEDFAILVPISVLGFFFFN